MSLGSNTADELKANMLRYTAMNFLNFSLIHYRYTGILRGYWSGIVNSMRADEPEDTAFSIQWPLSCVYHCRMVSIERA